MCIPSAGVPDMAPSDYVETVSATVTPVTSATHNTREDDSPHVREETSHLVTPEAEERVVDLTAWRESVVVNENLPSSGAREDPGIVDLTKMEFMQVLGSSRFREVDLMKSYLHYYTAKYYNAGDNREGAQVFLDLIGPFLSFSHRYVMPILNVFPPTRTQCPIIRTEYSKYESLADVLTQVQLSDPPGIWNDATKLRMVIGSNNYAESDE
jgi:hypothetical protein